MPLRRLILTISILTLPSLTQAAPDTPKAREFLFTYQATLADIPAGHQARIWLPIPPSNSEQTVTEIQRSLPSPAQTTEDEKHHNKLLYFESKPDQAGNIDLKLVYRILRHELRANDAPATQPSQAEDFYLLANSRVPVGGKATRLIAGKHLPQDQLQCARALYDVVANHMTYRKDKPGYGNGDSDWACDSGFGNCTDFHSLFISLARYKQIPAKFEMGFSIPTDAPEGPIAGYHCWAKFKPQHRDWIPVDISEASKHPDLREYYFGNLTPDRVMFSTGRDLTLTPKQSGELLNFLIYPYVEVEGKPWPPDKIKKNFTYKSAAAAR